VSQSNYPPFEFVDKDHTRRGMCIELVRWIATEFGFRARFIDMPFKEAQHAVLSGKADVLTSFFYSKERDEKFDFTIKTWDVPALIFVAAERPDISGLKDLQGKVIAMQRGDYAAEFLKSKGIKYKLLPTATFAQAIDKVVSHEADAVIGDKPIVLYHLFSHNLTKKVKSVGEPLYVGHNCMGMRNGETELQSILNKGIRLARERGVISTITRKWLGTFYTQKASWYDTYISYILVLFAVVIILVIIFFLWNAQLRRTVQKKTKDLSQRESHLRTLLEAIPDMIWLKDPNGVYLSCNSRFERFFGAKESEIVGRTDYDFLDKEMADFFRAHDQAAIDAGKPCMNEEEVVYADDGHKELLETIKTPMYDSSGKLIGVLGIARDITGRKRTEKELLKIRKLESVGVLAGGIAHDFNNLLTAILGNIDLSRMYIDEESKAYGLLCDAEKAALRAKDLTQQLLTFSKGGEPVKKTTSIKEVIIDSANFVLQGSKVACHFSIPDDLWLVDMDSGQMSQVIQNIVINSRDALPEGGDVEISCANIYDVTAETGLSLPEGHYVKITIRDNGYGIPEKYLDRIFDPYFTTKQHGSGLGLAICHSITAKHDGYIFVESSTDDGTTFTIYLPASTKQVFQEENEKVGESNHSAGKTILVMDDEQIIRDTAKEMLTYLGHEVLLAEDGREAVEMFKKHRSGDKPIDVIIMDLTVPGGMGGEEAIKEILKMSPEEAEEKLKD